MSFIERVRTMDKRLRVTLVATALLCVPQIGQFVAIRGLNVDHRQSAIALLLAMAGIFIIPTSLILTLAVAYSYRKTWRSEQTIMLLAALNLLLALSLAWFAVDQCSWSRVFGMSLYGCR